MNRRRAIRIIAIALVALLGFQALAALAAPPDVTRAGTRQATGRAAFAYLGGLRTFAAAVLWNRIEPLFHDYYGESLENADYMLPTLSVVQALDPHFVQSYYLSTYLVGQRRGFEEGASIARAGVRNNPQSGLMRANLAQVLYLEDADKYENEIMEQVTAGMSPETQWMNDDERFEALAIFRDVYKRYGDQATADRISQEMERIRQAGGTGVQHDHDGDGVQDH